MCSCLVDHVPLEGSLPCIGEVLIGLTVFSFKEDIKFGGGVESGNVEVRGKVWAVNMV